MGSCKQKPAKSENDDLAGMEVVVTSVAYHIEDKVLTLSANTEADHTADLGFMVPGRIVKVNFEEGQYISKGQLIATIDPTDFNSNLNSANADLQKANDELKRVKIMYDRGSITESDYQTAIKMQLQSKAQQEIQAKRLRDTHLYAPLSGLLSKRTVEPGAIVSEGSIAFSIVNVEPIKITASVPESEIAHIKTGDRARIHIEALDSTYFGSISLIGAIADPAIRAYTVKINLLNKNRKIRPGMIADVMLPSKQKQKLLTLPAEAVLHDETQTSYVFVVNPSNKKAYKRKVSVGSVIGDVLEITSGLKENEKVIVGGQQKVQDGLLVTIKK
ncbi:efflux RND transporter periplasmic adaptor subunit [Pedobacter sp. L105]|uniref:efflux RND transporter periplasmic adaptor subunit n=1 Tax=Pedobacter sp. L105 TaxID=1641871 RepID=UPI00131A8DA8|nr:efflux RND transporter periplasmic adaptor subunit [Pedobacter sp. L105]